MNAARTIPDSIADALPRTVDWNALEESARNRLLGRPPRTRSGEIIEGVTRILAQVRADGDAALRALTLRFDSVELQAFAIAETSFEEAEHRIDPNLRASMVAAITRIEAFHRAGMSNEYRIDTAPGVRCERILRPIDRVGLYVPAGSAPLFSTVLMLGVPARLAGCDNIILCTPPRTDGSVEDAALVAARLCGIDRIYALGGAQAIAAMAYGSASVPRCDKLFGPGNAWVTEAKRQVSIDACAIDMPAGPSEVLVIADATARADFVAADLLAQAEHGPDSQVLLISDSGALIDAVLAEIGMQLTRLPRKAVATQALAHSHAILVSDLATAVAISNRYAPEHLILQVANPRSLLTAVRAAGSVFLGAYSPESIGDYCSGTNHVLPTDGWARSCSGVSVASFQRAITVQELSPLGLAAIGRDAVVMAEAEGLRAHAEAVSVRLRTLEGTPA
ncbi:MAG TPA: histidinol dehydrogenase [Xanthomonadaceae bacterium]|nr:histidinol dehydrogenase [Xanthomonadaceae bacterium]